VFAYSQQRMAFRVSVVAMVLALTVAVAAYAQQASYMFNIPTQDLGAALRAYAKASGEQVSFDGAMVRGKTSAPLIGSYTADAGIQVLLSGTGFSARRSPLGVLLVESTASQQGKSADLEEIIVTATKREVSIQKLPEAVSAVTSAQLDDLNAQTFQDYFRTVPGLMMRLSQRCAGVFQAKYRQSRHASRP
jgi:iron complex outermembrane recepter protein